MKTTLSILCDNCISGSGFVGEHGFSALIEQGESKYLFDTGPGMSLPINLNTFGKDLKGLEGIFLSHGHYDHTGGLKWAVEQSAPVQVVAHPDMFGRHMVFDPSVKDVPPRYVGCPVSREELERLGADFRFVEHTTAVVQGIRFVTGLDPAPENRPNDSRLFLDINGELIPDRMPDDASLLLETESGPVLVFGCAHAGPVNILDHVKNDLGVNRLTAVLGGTHLMFYGSRALEEFVAKVRELGVSLVGVSHCTGLEPALRLARELGDAFTMAAVGRVFEF